MPKIDKLNEVNMTEIHAEDPLDTRTQIPISDELKAYLALITPAILRVISKETTLIQEEQILGVGKDHAPKGPEPVTYRYYDKNISGKHVGANFKRANESQTWSIGQIFLVPRNAPTGVYYMNLPSEFFNGYVLEKTFLEKRPDETIEAVNIFQFKLQNGAKNIRLQFETREDVSSLQDKYPKSFHLLKITRTGE
jgi:hypothetical protein